MLHLTANSKIYLASKPVDFRKHIDGLAAICEQTLNQEPRSGNLFVFINKASTQVRVLCYEGNGYWLACKRLSRGRFKKFPCNNYVNQVAAHELKKILKGVLAKSNKSM